MNDLNDLELAMLEERALAEDTRGADEIAQSIKRIEAEVQEAVLDGAIRIGRELQAAKSKVPYGEWGAWLETNVGYSTRKAQNFMRIAEEYGRRCSEAMKGLSITQAVALLGLTAEQREAFVEDHDMESITTDQLQAEVRELRERARGDQQTIAQLMAEKDELMEEVASASCAKDDDRVDQLTQQLRAAEDRAKMAEVRAMNAEKTQSAAALGVLDASKRAQREAAAAKQEAAELRTKLKAAQKDLETVTAQKERTEEQLIEERTKAPQVVEKIPPEVEQELARLRAAAGRSEDVQRVRMLVEQLGNVCQQLRAQIGMVMASDPETGEKLRAAAVQVLTKQGMEM